MLLSWKSLGIIWVSVVLASPVTALSCLKPQLFDAFNSFADAPDRYVIGLGRFTSQQEMKRNVGPAVATDAVGVFTGRFLGYDGFGAEQSLSMKVTVECVANWCGNAPQGGRDFLMFLSRGVTRLNLSSGPCGGAVFEVPAPAQIKALVRCVRNGRCSDAVVEKYRTRP